MKVDVYKNTQNKDLVRVTFLYKLDENEKYMWGLLSRMLEFSFEDNLDLQRKLLKNYNAKICVNIIDSGDTRGIFFEIFNLNWQYTKNKEDITLECANILLEILLNIDKYLKSITSKQYNFILGQYQERLDKNKNSVQEYLREKIYGSNITLNDIRKEKVIEYVMNVFNNSNIYLQIISSEEQANNILKQLNFEILEKNKVPIAKSKFMNLDFGEKYVEKTSEEIPTNILYILQKEKLSLDTKIAAQNELLAQILNRYIFNIVREKYSLSYNPAAIFDDSYNCIYIKASFNKKDKEKVKSIIDDLILFIKRGNIEDDIFNYEKNELKNVYDKNKYTVYTECAEDLCENVNRIGSFIEELDNISKEEVIECLNEFKIKLVYYLGGK